MALHFGVFFMKRWRKNRTYYLFNNKSKRAQRPLASQ